MEEKITTITPQRTSRLGIGLRNSGTGLGEIVEVQGGHIVRSTGRKDRHSKVCTAKGPRDRRVRLAAHTAIQFYDVQDRLGYDRPSKAVDWLIKKAKNAIDELAELPAWNPIITCSGASNANIYQAQDENGKEENQQLNDLMIENEEHGLHQNGQDSSFLPPSLDSDAIADTIKSFFPVGANNSSSMQQFQSLPSQDLLQNQDLRLSLQSFQDPVMLHHHHHQQQQPDSHTMLTGTPLGFHENPGGWQEQFQHQQAAEYSRFHRLGAWNAAAGGDPSNGSGGAAAAAGYMFNVPQQAQQTPLLQQLFSHNHNQFFSQRGPLQSNNTSSVRAWMDPVAMNIANAMTDHSQNQHQQQQQHPLVMPMYPSTLSGIGFSSGVGGFPGFHVPTRIQGEEEEHDGYSDKPSSASSDSRH